MCCCYNLLGTLRSAAYLSIGDSAAALADGEAAISAKADWAKGYSRKGAALHAMKKYDEAEAAYAAGLVAVPGDASLEAALKEVRVCEGGVGGLDPV